MNAFTFGAVPSGIEHAGAKAVYVESTTDMILDLDDMEEKLRNTPDCKHVLVSHMKGKKIWLPSREYAIDTELFC